MQSKVRLRRYVAMFVSGIVISIIVFAWFYSSDLTGGAVPDDPQQVATGKEIYISNCAVCHGTNLEGQPNWRERNNDGRLPAPPHDDTGHTWHHPDEHLFRLTKKGLKPPLAPEGYESDMPSFEGVLSDQEIWAVLAFIKSRWPAKARKYQDRLNENYRK